MRICKVPIQILILIKLILSVSSSDSGELKRTMIPKTPDVDLEEAVEVAAMASEAAMELKVLRSIIMGHMVITTMDQCTSVHSLETAKQQVELLTNPTSQAMPGDPLSRTREAKLFLSQPILLN